MLNKDLINPEDDSTLTQKCAIAARHVRRYIAEFFLRIIIPEDESVLAKFFLRLIVHAGVIKIALFQVGEEALGFRTPELCPAQGHQSQKRQKMARNHALFHL